MNRQELDLLSLLRIQSGDVAALRGLYERYAGTVHTVCAAILPDADDAAAASRSAWLQICKRAAVYAPVRGSVAVWMIHIARSCALERRRPPRSEGERLVAERHAAKLNAAGAAGDATNEEARRQFAALPALERQAMHKAFFEGLPERTLAQALEVPERTVRALLRGGLERLAAPATVKEPA